jgi:hypothetical protein
VRSGCTIEEIIVKKEKKYKKLSTKNAFVCERLFFAILPSNFDCKIAQNIKNVFKYLEAHAALFWIFISHIGIGTIWRLMRRRVILTIFWSGFACGFVG